jgi:pimeloyl-ACP methyl ester carboxylesterase
LLPEKKIVDGPGGQIVVWDWPGAGPSILFAHATGFHGRCWDYIARLFPGRRRLALDFRGHGGSEKPAPPIPWRAFAEDLIAVAAHFDVHGAVAVGHSMGGHSVVEAAAIEPERFTALVLVDPVIYPPERYGTTDGADPSFIERRRARWSSPAEMYERFSGRPPFAGWKPEILRDYCEYGLLPDGNGFVLACAPITEAAIYRESRARASNLHSLLPRIAQPVTVMRAAGALQPGVFDLSASPTWDRLAAQFPRGRDLYLPERNHYIPMEAPELVAEQVAQAQA